ncbi:hypothetical protein E2C01_032042 [Portunus trituberculatus]|uniref:Uncharacterized protein n=1 Tax=Portunus trituberculatus TaxID=210409 RepID=A0A5B7F0A1_PORTR|nr:hypothetical protein [Portunus trituberculatus]
MTSTEAQANLINQKGGLGTAPALCTPNLKAMIPLNSKDRGLDLTQWGCHPRQRRRHYSSLGYWVTQGEKAKAPNRTEKPAGQAES